MTHPRALRSWNTVLGWLSVVIFIVACNGHSNPPFNFVSTNEDTTEGETTTEAEAFNILRRVTVPSKSDFLLNLGLENNSLPSSSYNRYVSSSFKSLDSKSDRLNNSQKDFLNSVNETSQLTGSNVYHGNNYKNRYVYSPRRPLPKKNSRTSPPAQSVHDVIAKRKKTIASMMRSRTINSSTWPPTTFQSNNDRPKRPKPIIIRERGSFVVQDSLVNHMNKSIPEDNHLPSTVNTRTGMTLKSSYSDGQNGNNSHSIYNDMDVSRTADDREGLKSSSVKVISKTPSFPITSLTLLGPSQRKGVTELLAGKVDELTPMQERDILADDSTGNKEENTSRQEDFKNYFTEAYSPNYRDYISNRSHWKTNGESRNITSSDFEGINYSTTGAGETILEEHILNPDPTHIDGESDEVDSLVFTATPSLYSVLQTQPTAISTLSQLNNSLFDSTMNYLQTPGTKKRKTSTSSVKLLPSSLKTINQENSFGTVFDLPSSQSAENLTSGGVSTYDENWNLTRVKDHATYTSFSHYNSSELNTLEDKELYSPTNSSSLSHKGGESVEDVFIKQTSKNFTLVKTGEEDIINLFPIFNVSKKHSKDEMNTVDDIKLKDASSFPSFNQKEVYEEGVTRTDKLEDGIEAEISDTSIVTEPVTTDYVLPEIYETTEQPVIKIDQSIVGKDYPGNDGAKTRYVDISTSTEPGPMILDEIDYVSTFLPVVDNIGEKKLKEVKSKDCGSQIDQEKTSKETSNEITLGERLCLQSENILYLIQLSVKSEKEMVSEELNKYQNMVADVYHRFEIKVKSEQIVMLTSSDCTNIEGANGDRNNRRIRRLKSGPEDFRKNIELDKSMENVTMEATVQSYTWLYFYVENLNGSYNEELTVAFIRLWNSSKVQLPPFIYYKIKDVKVVLSNEPYDESEDMMESNAAIITAIIMSSIIVVILIISAVLLLFWRHRQAKTKFAKRCTPVTLDDYSLDNISVFSSFRRKQRGRSSKRSYTNSAFEDCCAPSRPLSSNELVQEKKEVSIIENEFRKIPNNIAKLEDLPIGVENKNRYANVIPAPDTRVFLTFQEGYNNSDYINANYVRGSKSEPKKYIITQGPMDSTCVDFWRMIWEQQIPLIMMLTDFAESGMNKCADYYPRSETLDCSQLHGDFQVTLERKELNENSTTSYLILKDMDRNLKREVIHMWLHSWPEIGVPESPRVTMDFLLKARKYQKDGVPTVVHCSPGTGRSGTIVACDIAMKDLEQSPFSCDLPRIVLQIRQDRAGSVQTKEQYVHIYNVISLYATKVVMSGLPSQFTK